MNQDLSMYHPAAFSIIYGLENTPHPFNPAFKLSPLIPAIKSFWAQKGLRRLLEDSIARLGVILLLWK